MIIIVYSILIILSALTDALFFNEFKAASKLVETIFIAGMFFLPLFYRKDLTYRNLFDLGLIYVFLRISLFDVSFNLFSGLDLNHVGNTTYIWDTLMSYLSCWQFWVLRGFFFGLALLIYFKKIKRYD